MQKWMALSILTLLFFVPAYSASAEDLALQTVRRYSDAFNAGDCETMYELSSPAVLQRDPEQWHTLVCESIPEWHRAGIREKLGRVRGRLQDGEHRLVIVHQKRIDRSDSMLKIHDGDYVIHSEDAVSPGRFSTSAASPRIGCGRYFPPSRASLQSNLRP